MSQDAIISTIVDEFKAEPRNKIIIDSSALIPYIREELGCDVNAAEICDSLKRYEDGEATSEDACIIDAGTSLCHQVANRCWGECIDDEYDEWSEVDISTEWSGFDDDETEDFIVTVYAD